MNISRNLQPQTDRSHYVQMNGRMPYCPGAYIIDIMYIGRQKCRYCDGAFYFANGDQVPDSIILGWK